MPSLRSSLRLNQVVEKIDYSGEEIMVSCNSGQDFKASKVLVTVPISIL
jgi:monoamine oxidase